MQHVCIPSLSFLLFSANILQDQTSACWPALVSLFWPLKTAAGSFCTGDERSAPGHAHLSAPISPILASKDFIPSPVLGR